MTDRTDADYGRGEYELETDAVAMESATEFANRLRAHFAAPGYTPPLLPAVALQIQSLSQKPNVDVAELVSVMEKDPLFAARVLKIAQSAAFATAGGISSLRDAVVRIGLRNLTDIAWEVAMTMRVFRSPAYAQPMEAVRRHSTACANLAKLISSFTSIATEYAFLCGLLHDIGMAASLIVLGEQKAGTAALDPMLLGMVLRRCHQEASQVIATLWKLPGDVQLVIGHHHDVQIQGFVHPLAAVVAVAEQLARELGYGVPLGGTDCDNTDELALARARDSLKLDAARMEKLREQAKKLATTFEQEAPAAAAPARPGAPPAAGPARPGAPSAGARPTAVTGTRPAFGQNTTTGTRPAFGQTGTMPAFKPPIKR